MKYIFKCSNPRERIPWATAKIRVLDMNPKTVLKRKKRDLIEIKIFCSVKYLFKRVVKQVTDWEKIFANYIFHK